MSLTRKVSGDQLTLKLNDQSGATTHLLNLESTGVGPLNGVRSASTGGGADLLTGLGSSIPRSPAADLGGIEPSLSSADGLTGLLGPTPSGPQSGSTSSTAPDAAAGSQLYIVFLDQPGPGTAPGLANRVQQLLGGTAAQDLLEHLNGFTARLNASQVLRLRQTQGVRSIEADRMVTLVQPVDVSTVQATSGVSAAGQTTPYGVPMVWGGLNYSTADNRNKFAFVLDTGVSTKTNDLNINSTYSRNFTSNRASDWIDYHGHGTHVSGTIAAVNDADGVVGVAAGANIISIRVLDRNGSGQTSWIVNGINYAAGLVKTGALKSTAINNLVANMSLGGGLNSSIDNAVRAAANPDSNGRYLRFAIAAGNSGADIDNYSPANTGDAPNIYTVSAVDSTNTMASWSNFDNSGDSIDDCDFSAPGVGVVSLGMSAGTLVSMSGTSMASPHMAGVLLMGTPLDGPLSTPVIAGASGDPFVHLS